MWRWLLGDLSDELRTALSVAMWVLGVLAGGVLALWLVGLLLQVSASSSLGIAGAAVVVFLATAMGTIVYLRKRPKPDAIRGNQRLTEHVTQRAPDSASLPPIVAVRLPPHRPQRPRGQIE